MSTGPTTLPAGGDIDQPKRHWLPRLRNARIRSKLALILVVPVAAVIALATVRLVTVGEGAYDATRAKALTELSIDISALAHDMHAERMAATVYLASTKETADAYNLRVRSTDERVQAYREERERIGEVPSAVSDRLVAIDEHLTTLDAARQQVLDRRQMAVSEAALRYGVILADLVAYGDGLAQLPGDEQLADARRAVAAFGRAKAAVAEQESVAYTALSVGSFDEEQYSSFVATLTGQQEALLAFSLAASPSQRSFVDSTVSGDAVTLADKVAADITRSVGQRSLVSAADASAAIGAVNDLMRWTEARLQERLLADTEQTRANVLRQAIVESLLGLLTLIIAIALAVVLARSLNHSLRLLREGALAVAHRDLPEAVRRLQSMQAVDEGGVDDIVREVREPIRLNNQDEVGQVALAFNVVHREAVRVAAEQAALRTSVSAMFLNLARRSQNLVDRMIGELDAIERGEEDPKRLARLFELDHLATRMRRNDENLLVLAGADSTVPRREDALLVDVLRAAQSEVELYNRIEFGTVDTDVSVAAHAVNDVVRLVAELLDNATRFSPPNTTVVADGRRIRDYVLIQVEDRGLGLSDEQLESLNRRLAEPSSVDVAAFRLMGLAVVSRLADRYGIRVELRRNVEGGTVAQVTLPTATVVLPVGRGPAQISRPRQPLAVEQGPSTPTGLGGPLVGATRAATLPEQRPPEPAPWQAPEPAPWQAPEQARSATAPVQAGGMGGMVGASPGLGATGHPGDAPTAAYPLPQRNPSRDSSAATAGFPTVPGSTPPLTDYGSTGGLGADLAATASFASTPLDVPPAAPPAPPQAAPPAEAPIFREMEAVWFRSHGNDATAIFTRPDFDGAAQPPAPDWSATAGGPAGPQLPTRVPGATTTPSPVGPPPYTAPTGATAAPASPTTASPVGPPPAATPTGVPTAASGAPGASATSADAWRTVADDGWSRASRAAEPASGGTTRSGLPKRVPKAQLVPGGIEPRARERTRRTPDEVRGLLSAYHRGVQRGRAAGSDPNSTSSKETS
ncbi:nitrate- and nitrite sensing domain-containing protein [Salinispora arenicola]|uniref:sensor histidine kinase n=2 Tax=Salinispora arenicola TaxID=168697 RepID=UPI0003745226|nr:nitrate- and nitrite sensing domain-containing protein [Salinispora arenicola]